MTQTPNIFKLGLFILIPYIMESGFYWLPLSTDHLSDTYTTFCVALFGAWLYFASYKQWFTILPIKFTAYYMIVLYAVWSLTTLAEHTTLGFNALKLSTIAVYSISVVLTYVIQLGINKLNR